MTTDGGLISCKHCGTPIPFEELDRGHEVYCKSCARANEVPLAEAAVFIPRVRRRRPDRRFHPVWIPVIGALLGAVLWLSTQITQGLLRRLANPKWADELLELDESNEDLAGAVEPLSQPPFEPVPEPEVTLARIEQLPSRPDRLEALVQAQVWQELLKDLGVPGDDRRQTRLQEIIVRLQAEIAPSASETARRLGQFDQALRTAAEAVRLGDTARARESWNRAAELFRKRPEELAFGARRLLTLKIRLQTCEAAAGGARRIEQLLEQAGKDLGLGRISEAMRGNAEARFLGRITPGLDESDAQRLHALAQRLAARLQRDRGMRAAAQAREADRLHDPATRDRQAFQAFSLLAGMPEEEIRPHLDGLREWYERAIRSGGAQGLPESSSPLGREIRWHEAYESVLDCYGEADAAKLAAAYRDFVAAERAASSAGRVPRPQGYAPVEEYFCDVLERELIARLAALSGQPPERLEPTLVALGGLLDQAGVGESHDRWMLLDTILRGEGDALASRRLASAVALAKDDQLDEAITEAAWPIRFGGPDIRRRAAEMRKTWQDELHLRTRSDVSEKAWRRLEALHAKDERLLEFYQEAQRFLQRYPRSPHSRDLRRWKSAVEPQLPDRVAPAMRRAISLLDRQEWSRAWAQFALLASVPVPPAEAAAFQGLRTRLDEVKAAADREFLLLDQARALTEETHVMTLLEGLPQVLAKDPEHAEARRLLESARRQGTLRAGKVISAALALREAKPEKCRERLERAGRLDPGGPCGKKAEALLGELGGRFVDRKDSITISSIE